MKISANKISLVSVAKAEDKYDKATGYQLNGNANEEGLQRRSSILRAPAAAPST